MLYALRRCACEDGERWAAELGAPVRNASDGELLRFAERAVGYGVVTGEAIEVYCGEADGLYRALAEKRDEHEEGLRE